MKEQYRWESFSGLLDSGAQIKRVLLDQKKLAGLGNIYATESLFRAGVDPWKKARNLSTKKAKDLYRTVPKVLREAIEAEGTTIDTYRDASGESGNFQNYLRVYDREGDSCPRCETKIARKKQGSRSTYYCPQCQNHDRPEEV